MASCPGTARAGRRQRDGRSRAPRTRRLSRPRRPATVGSPRAQRRCSRRIPPGRAGSSTTPAIRAAPLIAPRPSPCRGAAGRDPGRRQRVAEDRHDPRLVGRVEVRRRRQAERRPRRSRRRSTRRGAARRRRAWSGEAASRSAARRCPGAASSSSDAVATDRCARRIERGRVQPERRIGPLRARGRTEPGQVSELGVVPVGDRPAAGEQLGELLELGDAERGRDVRQAIVEADLVVVVGPPGQPGLGRQVAGSTREGLLVGDEHPAAAGRDELVAVEAEAADAADRSDVPAGEPPCRCSPRRGPRRRPRRRSTPWRSAASTIGSMSAGWPTRWTTSIARGWRRPRRARRSSSSTTSAGSRL